MNAQKEIFNTQWKGIEINIVFIKNYFGSAQVSHLKVSSKGGQPLPISESGFRSIWLYPEHLDGGITPVQFVLDALEVESNTKKWKDILAKQKIEKIQKTQLRLF